MNDLVMQIEESDYTSNNKADKNPLAQEDPVTTPIYEEKEPPTIIPEEKAPSKKMPKEKEPPLTPEEQLDPSKNPIKARGFLWRTTTMLQ